MATHKLSRIIAKDPVTSPLRAPFTTFEGTSGPAELAEEPSSGQGLRACRPAESPRPGPYRRRRSVALATFAMIAANGGMASATADMMTAASTE